MDSNDQETDVARDRSQLNILEQNRRSLLRKRALAEKLRKHNVKATQRSSEPEEMEKAEERYTREMAETDADLERTEDKIRRIRFRMEKTAGRILLVDDEKNIRLTVSRALAPLEMPVETAADGEEALRKLEENGFSMLLLDLKMPGIDGMTVLEEVRRRWPNLLVVILTAYGSIDIAVDAMKMGAADFIQKPFSPQDIRDLVKTVFERGPMEKEL